MIFFEINQQAGKKIARFLWRKWFKKIEKALKVKKELNVSVALVGDLVMKKLNQTYRGRNSVTNVLSFRDADSFGAEGLDKKNFLGEIVICYPQAVREARKSKINLNNYLEFLLAHGFLHLLGYDHVEKKDAEKMEVLERKIIGTKIK